MSENITAGKKTWTQKRESALKLNGLRNNELRMFYKLPTMNAVITEDDMGKARGNHDTLCIRMYMRGRLFWG